VYRREKIFDITSLMPNGLSVTFFSTSHFMTRKKRESSAPGDTVAAFLQVSDVIVSPLREQLLIARKLLPADPPHSLHHLKLFIEAAPYLSRAIQEGKPVIDLLTEAPQALPATPVAFARRKVEPRLPPDVDWPTERFDESPEKGKHGGLILYLRRVWKTFMDDFKIEVLPLTKIGERDESVASAIYRLRNRGQPLPTDIKILTEKEYTDYLLASRPDALARAIVERRRRTRIPDMK
jgi:hypothetical protein